MNARSVRFPLIDSARALACVWVMVFHAAAVSGFITSDNVLRPFVYQAGTAAMMFFLVSGFLLYRPFASSNIGGRAVPDLHLYGWRRVLRVVPGYWLALTLVALALGLDGVFSGSGIPRFYGFAQIYNWRTALGGIGQAWTLCVEMTFYAFLPLWALAMRWAWRRRDERGRVRAELAALALLAIASVAYKVLLLTRYDPASFQGGPKFIPLPNYLDAFAIGMALAVVSAWNERSGAAAAAIDWVRRRTLVCWLAAAAALWLAGTPLGFSLIPGQHFTRGMFLGRFELQILAGALILLPAFFVEDGGGGVVARVLSKRWIRELGLVSYGFYLYHYAIINLMQRHMAGVLPSGSTARFGVFVAVALVAGMAIGAASYYGLERPLLELTRRRRRVAAPAVADPAPLTPPDPPRSGVAAPVEPGA